MDDLKQILHQAFYDAFKKEPELYFTCGGRFEILGNHTDHNHGLCLAATCDLTINIALKKREDNIVEIEDAAHPGFKINLNDLEKVEEEKNSSPSLVRGIARYYKDHGYQIGGFTGYINSYIFPGAGVSSSAAFELLFAQIFNELYNANQVPKMDMAKAGQYAENVYFGKKCGLLDQIGVGFGNISYIDFKDINSPLVKEVKFPFDNLHFVIVNTGGSHAELSDLYSAIPSDMHNAAKKVGHDFLIEGSLKEIEDNKDKLSEIEYTRAQHFYGECQRVKCAIEAINNKDESSFLSMINGSRKSSTELLKNMMVGDHYIGSPLEACDLAMKIMENHGACKINGGGFAGSIICAVPNEYLSKFIIAMSQKYGDKNIKEVHVSKVGPHTF